MHQYLVALVATRSAPSAILDSHPIPCGLRKGGELLARSRFARDVGVVHLRFCVEIICFRADGKALCNCSLIAGAVSNLLAAEATIRGQRRFPGRFCLIGSFLILFVHGYGPLPRQEAPFACNACGGAPSLPQSRGGLQQISNTATIVHYFIPQRKSRKSQSDSGLAAYRRRMAWSRETPHNLLDLISRAPPQWALRLATPPACFRPLILVPSREPAAIALAPCASSSNFDLASIPAREQP